VKIEDRPWRERFETNHLEGLKIHGHSSSLPGGKLSAPQRSMAREKTQYIVVARLHFPNLLNFHE
jgi:hypothetical protein